MSEGPAQGKFYNRGRDNFWRGIARRESSRRPQFLGFAAILQAVALAASSGASAVRPENAFPKPHLPLPAFQFPHDFPVAALLHRDAPPQLSVFSEIADLSPSRAGAGPATLIVIATLIAIAVSEIADSSPSRACASLSPAYSHYHWTRRARQSGLAQRMGPALTRGTIRPARRGSPPIQELLADRQPSEGPDAWIWSEPLFSVRVIYNRLRD